MPKLLMVSTVEVTLRAFLLPHARALRAAGWQVDGMAQGITGNAECAETFHHTCEVAWTRNPLDPRNLLHTPHAIRALVAREGYDIVHVHTPVAAFVTRYALRHLRRAGRPKVIYTAHGFHFHSGGSPMTNAAFLTLEKTAGRWTDYLVVINREDEAAAHRHHIVPADRVCYMAGIGVDPLVYGPERVAPGAVARVREELGLTDGAPLFLMIAEFIPRKRHRDALQAFARLQGRHPAYLAFAGDGPLQAEMRALAEELGVAAQVRFLGFRRDIPALILSSRATLLPSGQEGLPRSTMESLCLGVPAIGADIRGVRDLLEDECGLLAPVGDIDALAEAMAWMAGHPAEAETMGRRGRAKMHGPYQMQAIIDAHAALYRAALALPTVSAAA